MNNQEKELAYTIRWNANEILKKDANNTYAKDIVFNATKLIGDTQTIAVPLPKVFPTETGLYPPFANVMKEKMRTHGKYAGKGTPIGAIVHFTAGHDGAENTIRDGIKNGYAYYCIQRDGKLFCAHPYNEWGYHAGESKWKNIIGGVSDDLIGIEMNAGGQLTKQKDGTYKSWFGKTYQESEVRYCDGSSKDQCKGYYHKYTPEQEATLIKTILWLKARNPDVFSFDNVLGHCEVSGILGLGYWRKNDPSSALSMTMPEFRELLKKRYEEIKS